MGGLFFAADPRMETGPYAACFLSGLIRSGKERPMGALWVLAVVLGPLLIGLALAWSIWRNRLEDKPPEDR